MGYNIVELPKVAVSLRADFILQGVPEDLPRKPMTYS
jgi:hypothetical protein